MWIRLCYRAEKSCPKSAKLLRSATKHTKLTSITEPLKLPPILIRLLSIPPVIDGTLDDAAWQAKPLPLSDWSLLSGFDSGGSGFIRSRTATPPSWSGFNQAEQLLREIASKIASPEPPSDFPRRGERVRDFQDAGQFEFADGSMTGSRHATALRTLWAPADLTGDHGRDQVRRQAICCLRKDAFRRCRRRMAVTVKYYLRRIYFGIDGSERCNPIDRDLSLCSSETLRNCFSSTIFLKSRFVAATILALLFSNRWARDTKPRKRVSVSCGRFSRGSTTCFSVFAATTSRQ